MFSSMLKKIIRISTRAADLVKVLHTKENLLFLKRTKKYYLDSYSILLPTISVIVEKTGEVSLSDFFLVSFLDTAFYRLTHYHHCSIIISPNSL